MGVTVSVNLVLLVVEVDGIHPCLLFFLWVVMFWH